MNIVYSSSDSYAQVMGVSLFSLLKNNTDSPELNIFIIDNNISDKNKDKVVSMCRSFDRGVTFKPLFRLPTLKSLPEQALT